MHDGSWVFFSFLSKWRQRGDDFTECVKSLISICLYIENYSLNNVILTRFVLTIFVKELSKIAPKNKKPSPNNCKIKYTLRIPNVFLVNVESMFTQCWHEAVNHPRSQAQTSD
jgi:hypothetical protein